MKLHFHRRSAITLSFFLALMAATQIGHAAEPDPAVARIQSFCDTLIETMKSAQRTPIPTRSEKLDAPVRATFDLPAMTRISIGPAWTTIPADQQAALIEQFSRFTIATYANRFDGYSGERFEVDPTPETRGENRIVHSTLVKGKGGTVSLNYLMHSTAKGWQGIDVYLSGTISELASRRSEFNSILKSGGPSALVDSLRLRADKLLQPAP
jgi:phospholipid transport system substrate-binding protein